MKTIVIAEAGVNHNGDFNKAKKLIKIAAKAKADYVKFQFYKTENLVTKNSITANYQKKNFKKKISQYELLKKYELNEKKIQKLINVSKKYKIKFLSSVFDEESLEKLFSLKIFDIKIPSGELNNYPLIERIAKKAKKIFISTGMATLNEIAGALKILKKNKAIKKNLFLMHCHTDYPTKVEDVNLRVMPFLQKKFKVRIGYSDHSLNNSVGIAAVSLGAEVIEKHFTISKKLLGPDHKASLEPKELVEFINCVRDTELLLGSSIKKLSKNEKSNKKIVRKSIVAKTIIKKGQIFSNQNIICKRPEGGMPPKLWNTVIGKKAKKNFIKDQRITL